MAKMGETGVKDTMWQKWVKVTMAKMGETGVHHGKNGWSSLWKNGLRSPWQKWVKLVLETPWRKWVELTVAKMGETHCGKNG